ncbi:MAG: hypothetical protein ABW166_03185 [Sedimenticola sp.]
MLELGSFRGRLRGIRIGVTIRHTQRRPLARYADKFNRYTSLQADEQWLKPYWVLVLHLLFAFPFDFIKSYFFKRHFTGGIYGFVLAVSHAYSRFLKSAKMLEKYLQKSVERSC